MAMSMIAIGYHSHISIKYAELLKWAYWTQNLWQVHPMQNNQPDLKLSFSLLGLTSSEITSAQIAGFCHRKWANSCDSFCCINLSLQRWRCLPSHSRLGLESSSGSGGSAGVQGSGRAGIPIRGTCLHEDITKTSGKREAASVKRETGLLLLSRNTW